MNIVFGQLVGGFNEYFIPGTNVSEQTFKGTVNQDRQDPDVRWLEPDGR